MMQGQKSAWPWFIVSVFVIIIDQITKAFAMAHLSPGVPMHIMPYLNFTLSFNAGAAFGFLRNFGGWQVVALAALALGMATILSVWLIRTRRHEVWLALALSLIIGGALGNFIDRVRLHYVIDFIAVYVGKWHFAIFNVADSAISIGAALLVLTFLLSSKRA